MCLNFEPTEQYIILPSVLVCFQQPPYENPEWFYRHVEMHSLCIEVPAGDGECLIHCGWKGKSFVKTVVQKCQGLTEY